MLRNKYFKFRSNQAWENYRKSHNKVSKLKVFCALLFQNSVQFT